MRRARPHQHRRRLKRKTITVNRGVPKRVRRKIPKLRIPPAWKQVSFPTNKNYLVTGVDEKGRTQYLYPESFCVDKSAVKYKRIDKLEKKVPLLQRRLNKDLSTDEAQSVYLMLKTGFRPGTNKDTKAEKKAYGAINLKKEHIKLKPKHSILFDFDGKKGVRINKLVQDKKLYDLLKNKKTAQDLFNTNHEKTSKYFKKLVGKEYSLKDLRTLKANQIAKQSNLPKKELSKKVAEELGNTPSIAQKSYINPKYQK